MCRRRVDLAMTRAATVIAATLKALERQRAMIDAAVALQSVTIMVKLAEDGHPRRTLCTVQTEDAAVKSA